MSQLLSAGRKGLSKGTRSPLVAFSSPKWRMDVSDNHTKRAQPDRSKINMHEAHEVKYWTHALGVTREELQKAIDKVGNSAATVRKELGKETNAQ